MHRWFILSAPLGLPTSVCLLACLSSVSSSPTKRKKKAPSPGSGPVTIAALTMSAAVSAGRGSTISQMPLHLSFTAVSQIAPLFFWCFFFKSPRGRCFVRLSLSEPSPVSNIHFLNRVQEGGCGVKAGRGCRSGSHRTLSAAANGEGARKALPSMEREGCCSKYAGREGGR